MQKTHFSGTTTYNWILLYMIKELYSENWFLLSFTRKQNFEVSANILSKIRALISHVNNSSKASGNLERSQSLEHVLLEIQIFCPEEISSSWRSRMIQNRRE